MAALDAVEADVVGEFYGGAEAPECRDVRAADALETFGANFGVVPTFGDDGVPEAVDDFVANVEEAGAFGGLQPLVRAGRVHVAAEVVDVEAHHAGDVGAVDGGENIFGAGQGGDFFGGEDDAGESGDVAEEDDASARGDGVVEKIEDLRGVFDRARERDFFDHDAVALGFADSRGARRRDVPGRS